MKHRLTYLAAPYTHSDPAVLEQRYLAANRACAVLMRDGPVFSPISHSHPVADHMDPALRLDHHFWQEQDTAILSHCSRVVVLKVDGWDRSRGVSAEIALADRLGIPVEHMEPDAAMLAPDAKLAMLADAFEIADEAAQAFIECECHSVTADGFEWSDLADDSDCDLTPEAQEGIRESLAQSERYLEARGLLIRHPERARLVRFREASNG